MDNYAEVIKKYQELKEVLHDTDNIVCFDTKNGRRRIIRVLNSRQCIPVDNRFRICSFENEENNTFYEDSLRLLESYFISGDVRIDDIFITKDQDEAFDYLNKRNN